MASFRKRSSRWQARITRSGLPPLAKTFLTKADAEKWARAIERELDLGTYVPRSEAKRTTLTELINRYKQEYVPQLRGAPTELVRLATLQSALGNYTADALSIKLVAEYRDKRLKLVTPSTVLRELQTLSVLLNHASREWDIKIANPVSAIRKPAPNKSRERRLLPHEEQRLLAALEGESRKDNGQFGRVARNPWIRPLVLLALETAMRRGELLALRWEHIDLRASTAHLSMTRNGTARTVPLLRQPTPS